ncbi:MAG TPA: hypothetical protein VIJ20_03925 [Solirubrobacteraceae bacterium]
MPRTRQLTATAATLLFLLLAGCGSGSGSGAGTTAATTSTHSSLTTTAFSTGFLTFQQATNQIANATTPLADKVSASRGSSVRMSDAFITLGRRERGLAARWHAAIVAFEALKAPPGYSSLFAATSADATKLYTSLRTISHQASASSRIFTARQFIVGGKDLEVFSTRARALGADFDQLAQRLGLS